MLIEFFFTLRRFAVKTTLREFLDLLAALDAKLVEFSIDEFYQLARLCLIKDEAEYDKFDRAFAAFIEHADQPHSLQEVLERELPAEWLTKLAEKHLSAAEKAQIEAAGGFEELMKKLQQRLAEQKERHQGGNKWIGTAGTSPFGAYGYNPQGVRIGQANSRHQRAVKVWDQRQFKDFDHNLELGTRSIKMALRKLRRFAREGANEELDLAATIRSTAQNAGYLDLKMVKERHNAVKVLLFMDVGGSMDEHVQQVAELFSACKTEFKHLEYYYFHNCVYESVWQDNARRHHQRSPLSDVLNTYDENYKLIIVGDASMSPFEIAYPGGSVEHYNQLPGAEYMQQLCTAFKKVVWLNPVPKSDWQYTQSIQMMREIVDDKMFPLTLSGLDGAIAAL